MRSMPLIGLRWSVHPEVVVSQLFLFMFLTCRDMKNQAMTSVSSFVQLGNHSFLTLLMLTGAGCGDEQPLDWSDSDSNNEVFYADVGKSARQFTEWQHSFEAWSVDNKYLNHIFYQCFLGLHH
jgi:hypothetical protein